MHIIFDFDNTLFNNELFLKEIRNAFNNQGVPDEVFDTTSLAARDGELWRQFQHMELLSQSCGVPYQKLLQSLENIIAGGNRFLYADTEVFLNALSGRHEFFIVTFGENEFQRMKIAGTGIERYFQDIIVTQDVFKDADADKILSGAPVLFVDDNPSALEAVKARAPHIITARMRRGHGKYANVSSGMGVDYEIQNLSELQKILS